MDERITPPKLQQRQNNARYSAGVGRAGNRRPDAERGFPGRAGYSESRYFTELNIQSMTLAGGALREGLRMGCCIWR